MSWLRIDDGFSDHPKIGVLTDSEFRVWIRTLCYCARYRDPTVDDATIAAVSGLNSRRIRRFFDLNLLQREGDGFVVHDWDTYAPKDPTGAARQAKWRANRNGTRNGDSNGESNGPDRYETVSRAQERAGVSVPSRIDQDPVTEPVLEQPTRETKDDGTGSGATDPDEINRLLTEAAVQDMPAW